MPKATTTGFAEMVNGVKPEEQRRRDLLEFVDLGAIVIRLDDFVQVSFDSRDDEKTERRPFWWIRRLLGLKYEDSKSVPQLEATVYWLEDGKTTYETFLDVDAREIRQCWTKILAAKGATQ